MQRLALVFAAWATVAAGTSLTHADNPYFEIEAYSGQPFGVGYIRTDYREKWQRYQAYDVTYELTDDEKRTHYPAYGRHSVPGAAMDGQIAGTSAYFLFRGDQPMTITFDDGISPIRQTITPKTDSRNHAVLLGRWAQQYFSSARAAAQSRHHLPVVENYTVGMLVRRLKLEQPTNGYSWDGGESWGQFAGYFLGTEELRLALQQKRLLGSKEDDEPLDTPLPVAASPPPIEIPDVGDIELSEPLAAHVPAECFYVRFRSYADSRWFRQLLNTWGGEVRETSKDRSLDYGVQARMERQLALRETDLAKLLGEHVIGEMAFIGTDMFVREGASLGVLFQAKQGTLLSAAIAAQRAQSLAEGKGVSEQTIEIAGHRVSFLSTPDNRVRSYYAVDGDFHLVTTSSTLVRRFFEAGQGNEALADLKEFRWARSKQPADANNAVLMYLSDPFIRLIVSPAYRVEMTRRMRADADLELLELARLAAKGEEAVDGSIDELIAGGFLPPGFQKRADGSRVVLEKGVATDSMRGARRSFVPVFDVVIDQVTRSEAEAYQAFARFYRGLYERMDPAVAWVRQRDDGGGTKRIVVDFAVTPFTRQNLGGLAAMLAPATSDRLGSVDGAMLSIEALTNSRIFAGLLDHDASFSIKGGQIITPDWVMTSRPIYVGERGHFIRSFLENHTESRRVLGDGYFEFKSRAYFPPLFSGWQQDQWLVIGGDLATVRQVVPALEISPAERLAQVRLHIGDLGRSKLAPICRAGLYLHDRGASQSNARLLDTLRQQLHVADDEGLAAFENVLAARPVCPLGGTYSKPGFIGNERTVAGKRWSSSAWGQRAPQTLGEIHSIPEEYEPQLLDWFRGLDAEIRFEDRTFWTHVELHVAADPK